MTNKEKFRNEIEDIVFSGNKFAFIDSKVIMCKGNLPCKKCAFDCGCSEKRLAWLKAEYKEKKMEVDWSKVPVDTPVFVRNTNDGGYHRRHFAEYTLGHICAWNNGKTSFTGGLAEYWDYAKLAEPHPEWMKEVE